MRKGERRSLAVYANRITLTESDDQGEAHEQSILFMKGYIMFSVEHSKELLGSYQPLPYFLDAEAAAHEGGDDFRSNVETVHVGRCHLLGGGGSFKRRDDSLEARAEIMLVRSPL